MSHIIVKIYLSFVHEQFNDIPRQLFGCSNRIEPRGNVPCVGDCFTCRFIHCCLTRNGSSCQTVCEWTEQLALKLMWIIDVFLVFVHQKKNTIILILIQTKYQMFVTTAFKVSKGVEGIIMSCLQRMRTAAAVWAKYKPNRLFLFSECLHFCVQWMQIMVS